MTVWMLTYTHNVFNLFLIKTKLLLSQKMDCEIKLIALQVPKSCSQLVGAFRDSWQDKMLQERCRIQHTVSVRERRKAAAQGVNVKAI